MMMAMEFRTKQMTMETLTTMVSMTLWMKTMTTTALLIQVRLINNYVI